MDISYRHSKHPQLFIFPVPPITKSSPAFGWAFAHFVIHRADFSPDKPMFPSQKQSIKISCEFQNQCYSLRWDSFFICANFALGERWLGQHLLRREL